MVIREVAVQKAAEEAAAAAEEDSALCVVCMDMPGTHAFIPCGHRCVCAACSETMLAQSDVVKCPVCRADFTQVVKIF